MRLPWFRCLTAFSALLICAPALAITLTGSLGIHDPSRILQEDGTYYMFGTGFPSAPIRLKYSSNFTRWRDGPGVFDGIPDWAQAEVPNNPGFMWAPSVIHFNNEYRLYYSVSSFGSQNSVIGMATNTTLDFNDPDYEWVDQQLVIESERFAPYNAIDPGLFYDESTQRMWLTFGSFWNGIFITELDPETGKRISPDSNTINIARNPASSANAIEAPYLMERAGHYYLFVNWDSCCQGVNSTYKIRVGRGTSPTGPFEDRNGIPMTQGGGELFLATENNIIGPGHFAAYSENGVNYFGYHYYNGNANGAATFAIDEFLWTSDGWPVRAADLLPGDFNDDGLVSAADYTLWRDNLGAPAGTLPNDVDSGPIGQAQYQTWKVNFGSSTAAASGVPLTVPEPTSLLLVVVSLVTICVGRRKAKYLASVWRVSSDG